MRMLKHNTWLAAVGAGALEFVAPLAVARMPNPDIKPFTDHSKPISLKAEAAPEHFAIVWVVPQGAGRFTINIKCENEHARERTDAIFYVEFRAGDEILYHFSKECHLPPKKTGPQQTQLLTDTVDLSQVIEGVSNVRFGGIPVPAPIEG